MLDAKRRAIPPPVRQRGWLGLVALLIALVIVAVLAQTVLRSYGMLGGGDRTATARARAPGAAAPAEGDATQATPSITAPIERARGLEQQVQRDAQDLDRRIDEQTK
jgi:Tfp pilus assembly protein PilE